MPSHGQPRIASQVFLVSLLPNVISARQLTNQLLFLSKYLRGHVKIPHSQTAEAAARSQIHYYTVASIRGHLGWKPAARWLQPDSGELGYLFNGTQLVSLIRCSMIVQFPRCL